MRRARCVTRSRFGAGRPLADLANEPFAADAARALEEERLAALETRIDADLACGRHSELVGELTSLVRAEPLRERLRAQLMLALYRCGRQSEALDAYADARQTLVSELGLEPGPELQELQQAILGHDEALRAAGDAGASSSTALDRARRDGDLLRARRGAARGACAA